MQKLCISFQGHWRLLVDEQGSELGAGGRGSRGGSRGHARVLGQKADLAALQKPSLHRRTQGRSVPWRPGAGSCQDRQESSGTSGPCQGVSEAGPGARGATASSRRKTSGEGSGWSADVRSWRGHPQDEDWHLPGVRASGGSGQRGPAAPREGLSRRRSVTPTGRTASLQKRPQPLRVSPGRAARMGSGGVAGQGGPPPAFAVLLAQVQGRIWCLSGCP